MSKFNVGDKVVIRDDLQNYQHFGPMRVVQPMRDMHGKTSTITEVIIDGNTLDQLDRYYISGSPWWWCNDCFSSSKAPYPVTVITTDGVTTTATLREGKRVIRTASAKCDPRDTFGYETGAKLAFNRLFPEVTETAPEPPKPKYYNGKLVLVSKTDYSFTKDFTVGKVYQVTDGRISDDVGWDKITRIPADLSTWLHADRLVFIPFVEF